MEDARKDRIGAQVQDSHAVAAVPALGEPTAESSVATSLSAALRRYQRCIQCQAHLHFTHVTDFHRNLTQESSRCLECGIESPKVLHRLQ